MPNEQLSQNSSEANKPTETTGTEKIVRQHMEDENHVITDEDIRNVEVGKFEHEPEYEGELSEDIADASEESGEIDGLKSTPPNPWDIKK